MTSIAESGQGRSSQTGGNCIPKYNTIDLYEYVHHLAIALGSPAAAGLVVAAKSVFRSSETRDRPFAEYFLIGTLLSVVLAAAGGIVLRIALF